MSAEPLTEKPRPQASLPGWSRQPLRSDSSGARVQASASPRIKDKLEGLCGSVRFLRGCMRVIELNPLPLILNERFPPAIIKAEGKCFHVFPYVFYCYRRKRWEGGMELFQGGPSSGCKTPDGKGTRSAPAAKVPVAQRLDGRGRGAAPRPGWELPSGVL